MNVLEAIPLLEDALQEANIPHAFGGAIALAYCTGEPRGTVDVDLNIFLPATEGKRILKILGGIIDPDRQALQRLKRDQQVRVRAGATPIDLFFSYADIHDVAQRRVRKVELAGTHIPILECTDLAVFKAMFDRTKDWADIIAAIRADAIDIRRLRSWITRLTSADDPRHKRLQQALEEANS